jgi:5-methylcytosine-specific restriction endonuclease McrA
MPIRPDLKDKYPKNWPEIRLQILHRANHRCEFCTLKNGSYGIRDLKGDFHHMWEFSDKPLDNELFDDDAKGFSIVLTIAHLDHDVENNDGMEEGGPALPVEDSNLRALCQQCHNRHDGPHRGANRVVTWDKKKGQGRFEFE